MNFNDAEKFCKPCVYKLTYPNGKCYIGQTKCLRDRIRLYRRQINGELNSDSRNLSAMREFGIDSVDISVLCEIEVADRSDLLLCLSILEIKYIRELNCIYPNGYNVGIGGEILGIPTDLVSTNSNDSRWNKPVLTYDVDGNFVAEYPSLAKCAYSLGVDVDVVSSNLDKRGSLLLNTYFLRSKRYGEIPQKIIGYKPKIERRVERVIEQKVIVKEKTVSINLPTLKYNLNGDFCGEYETRIDAAMSIGRRDINYGVPIRGYIFFKHDGGEIKQNIGLIEVKKKRLPKYSDALNRKDETIEKSDAPVWRNLINDFKIEQWTIYGEHIATFDNIRDASIKTGFPYSNIWACVFGRTRKSCGYVWKKSKSDNE